MVADPSSLVRRTVPAHDGCRDELRCAQEQDGGQQQQPTGARSHGGSEPKVGGEYSLPSTGTPCAASRVLLTHGLTATSLKASRHLSHFVALHSRSVALQNATRVSSLRAPVGITLPSRVSSPRSSTSCWPRPISTRDRRRIEPRSSSSGSGTIGSGGTRRWATSALSRTRSSGWPHKPGGPLNRVKSKVRSPKVPQFQSLLPNILLGSDSSNRCVSPGALTERPALQPLRVWRLRQ
jgi:hypothetical protein